ncbi:MAG: metallophosphoesterase [Dehalococcoidia bacterium]|nr:metallophosphoesterase [Dehalococcoidia bacterium]
MKIAHVSDLHFGSLNHIPEWADTVREMLDEMSPDILVITGDLTMDGYEHEFKEASAYMARLKCGKMLVVPGNHDARNEGFTMFEELFGTRFPLVETDEVVIQGIDSTEPDLDAGHIGRENYKLISDAGAVKNKVRILAIHHHLIPIPGTGRERHIPVDAGDALFTVVSSGINFVLSGHKHLPWAWRLQDTYFVTAGTATSRRLRGKRYPSFNVLDIQGDVATLSQVNVSDRSTKAHMVVSNLLSRTATDFSFV